MRLDRFLSNNSSLSRKQVKKAVTQGEVSINGSTATDPSAHIDPQAEITLYREHIAKRGLGYFMLNKPEGVVCANTHRELPIALEFIDEDFPKLQIAGTLDTEISGLVIVTGDGDWSHRLNSPKNGCSHCFLISTAEFVTDKMITKLNSGVFLKKDKKRSNPAHIEQLSDDLISLTTTHFRYRQITQMLQAVDNSADRICRTGIGPIMLDESLDHGEYRELSESEIKNV